MHRRTGFDNNKYIELQTSRIRERINAAGGSGNGGGGNR